MIFLSKFIGGENSEDDLNQNPDVDDKTAPVSTTDHAATNSASAMQVNDPTTTEQL